MSNVNPAIIVKNILGGKDCCLTADEPCSSSRGRMVAQKAERFFEPYFRQVFVFIAEICKRVLHLLYFFSSDWSKNLTQKLYTIISLCC